MQILKGEDGFYVSLEKALNEIDPLWHTYAGTLITGTHAVSPRVVDKAVEMLKESRLEDIPTLGICFGMQAMAIEWARNGLGIFDANTEEIGGGTLIVKALPGTMVGMRKVGNTLESHWNSYHVNIDDVKRWKNWSFVSTEKVVEVMELNGHPFYVGVQFHPEYQSSKDDPHPVLVEFVNQCKKCTVG